MKLQDFADDLQSAIEDCSPDGPDGDDRDVDFNTHPEERELTSVGGQGFNSPTSEAIEAVAGGGSTGSR